MGIFQACGLDLKQFRLELHCNTFSTYSFQTLSKLVTSIFHGTLYDDLNSNNRQFSFFRFLNLVKYNSISMKNIQKHWLSHIFYLASIFIYFSKVCFKGFFEVACLALAIFNIHIVLSFGSCFQHVFNSVKTCFSFLLLTLNKYMATGIIFNLN